MDINNKPNIGSVIESKRRRKSSKKGKSSRSIQKSTNKNTGFQAKSKRNINKPAVALGAIAGGLLVAGGVGAYKYSKLKSENESLSKDNSADSTVDNNQDKGETSSELSFPANSFALKDNKGDMSHLAFRSSDGDVLHYPSKDIDFSGSDSLTDQMINASPYSFSDKGFLECKTDLSKGNVSLDDSKNIFYHLDGASKTYCLDVNAESAKTFDEKALFTTRKFQSKGGEFEYSAHLAYDFKSDKYFVTGLESKDKDGKDYSVGSFDSISKDNQELLRETLENAQPSFND